MPSLQASRRHGLHGSPLWKRLAHRLTHSPIPSQPGFMLCRLVSEAFDDPAWTFEPKFDGLRVLARFEGRRLALLSRNGKQQNVQFPEIAGALRESLAQRAIVEGEVVCFDERGRTSFRRLQQRFHLEDPAEIQARMERYPAAIFVFDILYAGQYDLTSLPLSERKQVLREAVQWSDRVRWTESHPEHGKTLFRQACRAGEEGIIGKRLDSRYVAGRADAWVKIKCLLRQEFVIGGYTDPQRSRVGLGALLVGVYNDDRRRLTYVGKVGTGFTRETLLDLRKRIEAIEQRKTPFDASEIPSGPQVHWVKPRLVAEIAFAEWTQNGRLRQPRFEGLRFDKRPRDCRREQPESSREARRSASRLHTDSQGSA